MKSGTQREKSGFREDFGQRLASLRARKGWSQGDLARRLGVPRWKVGKWEQGCYSPAAEDLVPLSEVLTVPVGELLTGERLQPLPPAEGLAPIDRSALSVHLEGLSRLLKPLTERREAPIPSKQ
jgi:transcriptional regulator with XRE-family HTH domain